LIMSSILLYLSIWFIRSSAQRETIWAQETASALDASNWTVVTTTLTSDDHLFCPSEGSFGNCWQICAEPGGIAYIYRLSDTVGYQNLTFHYDVHAQDMNSGETCSWSYNVDSIDDNWVEFSSYDEYEVENEEMYNLPPSTWNKGIFGIKVQVTGTDDDTYNGCCNFEDLYLRGFPMALTLNPTVEPTNGPSMEPSIEPTSEPTTASPTTASPTTSEPTSKPTYEPTTTSPTTASPTTASPTTASPTTASPSSASPTSRTPTSKPTEDPEFISIPSPTASSNSRDGAIGSTEADSSDAGSAQNDGDDETGNAVTTILTVVGVVVFLSLVLMFMHRRRKQKKGRAVLDEPGTTNGAGGDLSELARVQSVSLAESDLDVMDGTAVQLTQGGGTAGAVTRVDEDDSGEETDENNGLYRGVGDEHATPGQNGPGSAARPTAGGLTTQNSEEGDDEEDGDHFTVPMNDKEMPVTPCGDVEEDGDEDEDARLYGDENRSVKVTKGNDADTDGMYDKGSMTQGQ